MKHLSVLDGIRGWAIIFVMLYHFTIPFQQMNGLTYADVIIAKILQMGWLGVDLFFVMSGFLITNILLRSSDKPNYYRNFYIRRFLRIFPLYYGLLILFLVIFPFLSDSLAAKTANMQENSFWFWTYLVNWKIASLGTFEGFQSGYMWSLAIEEQFYIFWPLFLRFFYNRLITVSVLLLVMSFILKLIGLYLGASGTTLYTMTFTHVDGLILGSIFGILYWQEKLSILTIKKLGVAAFLSILLSSIIAFITKGFVFYNAIVGSIGVTLASITFTYILVKSLKTERKYIFLKDAFVMKCGQLCYGLYLLHQPISVMVSERVLSPVAFQFNGSYILSMLLNVCLSLSLSFLIAMLSYKYYELPFLKLKKYFT